MATKKTATKKTATQKPAAKKPAAKTKVVAKKVAAKPAPSVAKKFSWKAFDKALDAISKLVDADAYAPALAKLEPELAAVPAEPGDEHDDALSRAYNLHGLALRHTGKHAAARAAFEHASKLGATYAELNLLDLMADEEKDFAAVVARARKVREEHYIFDAYTRVWLARYLAIAYLETGDLANAETELRGIVDKYAISDAARVREVRAAIEEYADANRPHADAARGFLAWLAEKSYAVAPAEAEANGAWWRALPSGARKELLKAINDDADPDADVPPETVARVLDVNDLHLDDDDGTFDDVTPFLRLHQLKRLAFYGDPSTIEPLRALPKLERVTINNIIRKDLAWPSPAQRALFAAAKAGDRDGIVRALADGASLAARDESGRTAFYIVAFEKRDLALCLDLVARGADPWAASHHGDAIGFFGTDGSSELEAAAARAGIPHPDSDPYRELAVAYHLPKQAACDQPEGADGLDLDDGEPLAATWPADVRFQLRPPKKHTKLYPVVRAMYDCALVDASVADKLRGEPNVELLPVTIVDHDGKRRPEKYFLLNPLAIDCLDVPRCFLQWNHIDPESASANAAFAIDPARVGAARLFRPTILNSRPMIVTKELAATLGAIEGFRIAPLRR